METKYQERELYLMEDCYRKHLCGMTCYAGKYVPAHSASDIVQDVFLKLWQHNRSFYHMADGSAQRHYLCKCVRNACQDWIKHNKIVNSHSGPIASTIKSEEIFWYERLMENEDFRCKVQRVNHAIETLPDRCQDIFIKHYLQQMKSTDIAIELGISVRTVETQLYKALNMLRKNLKDKNK